MLALCGGCEFLAQLTDKDVDDFKLWLVHAAVKVVKEHLFRQGRALTQCPYAERVIRAFDTLYLLGGRDDRQLRRFWRLGSL